MKHIFLIFLAVLFGVLTHAQTQFEVSGEGVNKVLTGVITRDLLMNDAACNATDHSPLVRADSKIVQLLKAKQNDIRVFVLGATWSNATRDYLPPFFSVLDAARFPEDHVTIVGVDSSFHSGTDLAEALHITSVPTIVIMENGKERGRISGIDGQTDWNQALFSLLDKTH